MEYLEGRTLKYYLKDEEPLDLDNVFAVSIQLAEGLASAHAKGIVHRDLKPGNIFVTSDGSLKLLDALPVDLWVGIRGRGVHHAHARLDDGGGAGGCAALVATGL